MRRAYTGIFKVPNGVFQNHYGWIEPAPQIRQRRGDVPFQNHYGWIETRVNTGMGADAIMFQNHYGWIGTLDIRSVLQSTSSFKTTTVGLRHAQLVETDNIWEVSKPLRLD